MPSKAASSSSSQQQQQHQNKSGQVPFDLMQVFPCEDLRDASIFYAIGDIGDYNCNRPLAEAMEKFARKTRPPDEIICLGDNFYPNGPANKEQAKTEFHSWRARFLYGALEDVPWKIVMGNHDRSGDVNLQLDYTNSKENPNGLWQCRGDDPTEKPSTLYTFSNSVYAKTSDLTANVATAKKQAQQQEEKKKAFEEEQKKQQDDDDEDDENSDSKGNKKAEKSDGEKATISSTTTEPAAAASSTKATTAADTKTQQQQQQQKNTATTYHPKTGSSLVGKVHFTVFETNVASGVVRSNPDLVKDWPTNCQWLYQTLEHQDQQKDTLFRVVLGHHLCYPQGNGHFLQGLALRAKSNKSVSHLNCQKAGLGFENILIKNKVDAYLSGHEHALNCTERNGGVVHAVVGATSHWEIYGGRVTSKDLAPTYDWSGPNRCRGFLVGCVTADVLESKTATMTLSFVAADSYSTGSKNMPAGTVMYTKTITKSL